MRSEQPNRDLSIAERYLLARVREKSVQEKQWWYDSSIDDYKRDVSYRLAVELLPDDQQLPGMDGYMLDTIRWARVEYNSMEARNSGSPPGIFYELQTNELIRIMTIPKSKGHVMIEVYPPRFPLGYSECRIQRHREKE